MAFLKSEDHFSVSAIGFFVKSLLVIVLGVGPFCRRAGARFSGQQG